MEQQVNIVMIPQDQLQLILSAQKDILDILRELQSSKGSETLVPKYLTIREFMSLARIGRTKCDELLKTNKILFVKKRRKIYIPAKELDRFFSDSNIL